MLAFDHPQVLGDDIVVTMDVNAFVVTAKILDPLSFMPDAEAWVFQYHETAGIQTGTGESFNQNIMSMRAKTWRRILDFRSSE